MTKRLFPVATFLATWFIQVNAVSACSGGFRTFDFADPHAVGREDKQQYPVSYVLGKVVEVYESSGAGQKGMKRITLEVLRDYSFNEKLPGLVVVFARFGDGVGGCGETLKLGQVGKFGIMSQEGELVLVTSRWLF